MRKAQLNREYMVIFGQGVCEIIMPDATAMTHFTLADSNRLLAAAALCESYFQGL